ncbi:MAG: nucleoid occlusion protein [Halanaerobiales bacterium]|nr:nucleoid occlusion protein [Halanaerobiales bacterium]
MLSPFMKKEDRIKYVDIEKILPNRYQPRIVFNETDLEELAQSIREHGIIQPLTVRKFEDGFELIVGERRLRASKIVGLEQVPVIIKDFDDEESAAIALVENLQRKDLDFIEEAFGFSKLIDQFGMTQQELAQKVGKSQSTVANKLRLLKLPKDIHKTLLENKLTERHARALLKLENEEEQRFVLKNIIERDMNVRDTEILIESIKNGPKDEKKKSVIRVFKDLRLYTNTLWATIKQLKQGGLDIKVQEIENDEFIEFKIRLPKNKE